MSENTQPSGPKRSQRHPRYDFRARSHESAHANHGGGAEAAIPHHPLIHRDSATLVATPAALSELIEHLRQVGTFAYDSEFIGELSYHPKLCLIQVATHQRIALIDSLADLDLAPFWELVADPAVEKVVHAGQQDLEPVFRHLGKSPANIFDTQVAAGFAALAYPAGLSKLVRELVGVQLGKGFTFTHWDQRPLSSVQLRYAADDVRYLPALRQIIGQRLQDFDHVGCAAEECAALCDPDLYRSDPAMEYTRIRGANSLSPRGLAVLRELVAWRELAAQTYDSPPRSYLKDEILVDIARNPAASASSLDRVRSLPRPVEAAEGENLRQAIQRGLAVPETDWPALHQQEELPGERFSADALWAVVQAWCIGHQLDPNLATSRQEIARFLRDYKNSCVIDSSRLLRGWRGDLLGRPLLQLLRSEKSMTLQWVNGALRAEA